MSERFGPGVRLHTLYQHHYTYTVFRHKTETRVESLCRVLDIPTPRFCVKRTQPIQQPNAEKGAEECIETEDVPVHVDSANACENGLVKVTTLMIGRFENECIALSSFGTSSDQ